MDEFEKVEKLRQRADVSYEDAKAALNEANGDLLDAMIILEKQGKAGKAGATGQKVEYFRDCEVDKYDPNCQNEKNDERRRKAKEDEEKFKSFCKDAWKKGNDNDFVMKRKDQTYIRIPVWIFILILIFTFHITLPVMLVSLFFGCRYGFEGQDDLSKVNEVMNQASEAADKVKEEYFTKSDNNDKTE